MKMIKIKVLVLRAGEVKNAYSKNFGNIQEKQDQVSKIPSSLQRILKAQARQFISN